jgi:hypothetical protein
MKSLSIAIPSVVLAITLTATAAHAESDRVDLTEESAAADSPDLSVTISPLHLAFGFLELTGEFALTDKTSIAAVAGAGSVLGVEIYEAGGQVRHYVLGSFRHGLGFGAEVLLASARTELSGEVETAGGVQVSPFVAYKYAAGFGMTVDLNAGAAYMRIADDESSESDVGLMLNINVGWSF